MKRLKKVMLAAGIAGLISTFGLAGNVFAAGKIVSAGQEGNDSVKVTYSTDTDGTLTLKLNGIQVDQKSVTAGTEKVETFAGIKDYVNSHLTQFTADSLDGFSVELTDGDAPYTGTLSSPLYKLAVVPGENGKTYLDDDPVTSTKVIYDYMTGSHELTGEGNQGYYFDRWVKSGATTGYASESILSGVHADGTTYTSYFTAAPVELSDFVLRGWSSSDTTKRTGTVKAKVNDTINFEVTDKEPADGIYSTSEWDVTGLEGVSYGSDNESLSGTVKNAGKVTFTATRYDGQRISKTINIEIESAFEPTLFKFDSDQLEYVTQGYTIEVKGTVTGTNRDDKTITIEKAKGDGIKVKDVNFSRKDDKTNNFSFKIDTSDCSVSSGETLKAVIKVTVKNGKEDSGVIKDLVNEEFFNLEVHPKSTLSYASDTRKFSYTAPKSVNTGTESGKNSDGDKDNQLTNFTGCKGVLIKVWKGDVSGDPLWTSTSATTGGNSATINAESLVTALNNDKKLSDSGDFKFRIYPCNGSNKYNKNVYSETTIHIYKATVNGTGITVANYYALSGQEIEIKAVPIDPAKTWTTDSYWMDDAAKKEGQTRKVKLTEDKTFTAVLGTKTTSDNSASGRAGVNKWGQSNVGIYFAIVFVIGAVCLGLHLYDRKKNMQ